MEHVLRQKFTLLVFMYCLVSELLFGKWSPAVSEHVMVSASEDLSISSTAETLPTGIGSLRSLGSETDLEEVVEEVVTTSNLISPLDIPEEDLASLQQSLPLLYHSPEAFALNYDEMTKRLRIFLYPSLNETKYEYSYDELVEVDVEPSSTSEFFRLLAKSKTFVTEDPKIAQLFFVPVSIDAMWTDIGPAKVAEQLRRYLQKVRDNFTFWDLSLGANHFYLSCHGYDPINHRNVLEFTKNAIQVACSPLCHNQGFFPHKDIVLPYYQSLNAKGTNAALNGKAGHQSTLAYFSAPLDVDAISTSILKNWTSDSDFELESDPLAHPSSTHKKLATSRFCVSVSSHATVNAIDSLRFGCVPVLISKSVIYDLPFQDILSWHEFSIVLGIQDVANLKHLLTTIPMEKYRQMQYLGRQASKHMEWNDPPSAYDAFHMTLFELWVRRHSIKYGRRSNT